LFRELNRLILYGFPVCAVLAGVLLTTASVMTPPETFKKMSLSSSAFKDGQPIPAQYTCEGKNTSPPLSWQGTPAGTQCLVLIVDDPDSPSGVFTHWVVFNLPADTYELPENFSKSPAGAATALQGLNDFKQTGYGGPCPPAGKAHRYYFKLFALDTTLDAAAGAARKEIEAAMTKHILAAGQLMGTYHRK